MLLHVKHNYSSIGKLVILSIIIFISTFPKVEPVFETGLDSPFMWVYNYYYSTGFQVGNNVIFSYGPLCFLLQPLPLGNNLIIGLIVESILRLLFAFTFLYLGSIANKKKWLLHFLLILILLQITSLTSIIIGIIIGIVLIHFENEKSFWLLLGLIIATLGFYIKSITGIQAFGVLISYGVIYCLIYRRYKNLLIILFSFPLLLIIFWFLLLKSFNGLYNFFYGSFQLINANSIASSLSPDNNWIIITGFISLFLAIPFLINQKKAYLVYLISALSLFAAWKHGFSREDIYHMRGFFIYLILFFSILFIYLDKVKKFHFMLISISLMLLYINMKNVYNYNNFTTNLIGINNFTEAFIEYHKLQEKSLKVSMANIQINKLDDKTRKTIDTNSVDIYPWDYSYIPANNLNWFSRPIIQNHSSLWLDDQNALHFSSKKIPQYIIWHYVTDRYDGEFGEIDNKYLLNNEPHALYSMLNHYTIISKTDKLLLLERSDKPNLSDPQIIKKTKTNWKTWVKVPEINQGILRAQIELKGNFLRTIKNFLYKDEEFFIEYKLQNGDVKKYRFIPTTAKHGLWINPLIGKPSNDFFEPLVTDIRFSCSNYSVMKEEIEIGWESIKTNASFKNTDTIQNNNQPYSDAFNLFGKHNPNKDSVKLNAFNDFEMSYPNWRGDTTNIISDNSFSGKKSYKMNGKHPYSHTYYISVGELNCDSSAAISVKFNTWFYAAKKVNGVLVVSVEENGNNLFWQAAKLEDFVTNYKEWNQAVIVKKLPPHLPAHAKIVVYVYSEKDDEFLIDDMNIEISKSAPL